MKRINEENCNCTKQMVVGGIEKALISMLNKFDYNKYDVTLFLTCDGRLLLKDIP